MLKNKRLIAVIAIIFIFAGVLIAINYLHLNKNKNVINNDTTLVTNHNNPKECCKNVSPSDSAELSENSIYQLNTHWINEYGKEFSLSGRVGRIQVITMFFASCSYACPLITEDMKKIENILVQDKIYNVDFILVSFDNARDKPKNLLDYSKSHKLDLNKWTILTGKESDIQSLAALLNFKLSKDSDGNFTHSNMITVLNKKGEIAYQHFGLGNQITDVIENIKKLN